MKRVNFLADDVFQDGARKRSRWGRSCWIPSLGVAVLFWICIAAVQVWGLHERVNDARVELEVMAKDAEKTKQRRETIHHAMEEARNLVGECAPVSSPAIIALFSQTITQDIVIKNLNMTAPRSIGGGNSRMRRRSSRNLEFNPMMVIQLSGTASTDVAISQFVGDLVVHPVFANIRIDKNEHVIDSHEESQHFLITVEVPSVKSERFGGIVSSE